MWIPKIEELRTDCTYAASEAQRAANSTFASIQTTGSALYIFQALYIWWVLVNGQVISEILIYNLYYGTVLPS